VLLSLSKRQWSIARMGVMPGLDLAGSALKICPSVAGMSGRKA